jgi:pimeloyl-ACP methyl ester carboxylesterase
VDNWEAVSVAFAAQGYVVVAISPSPAWDVDIEQHALDERIALHLARDGSLSPHIGDGPAMALGGSFTSAVLHRLLLDEGDQFNGWVTVGGIANAFSGAEAFYAGELELPPRYQFVIPALGQPNLFPLSFLRYSPVYTASQLPPTLIIHTGADHIIPIEQAHELEAALRASGVPVETFYYKDVSHYLQIGENMTPEGQEMFYLILDFIER